MLILDTQLLVLLIVGLVSKSIIKKHKNLTAYTEADYELLRSMLGSNPTLVLLPNIVTEASNLLRQHKDPERSRIMEKLRELIAACEEHYVSSRLASSQHEYIRLGITDSAILVDEAAKFGILTADVDLFLAAENRGLNVTNFNHHRERWGL